MGQPECSSSVLFVRMVAFTRPIARRVQRIAGKAYVSAPRIISPALDDRSLRRYDSGLHCPPTYSSAWSTHGAPSAPVSCVPGLPWMRCAEDQDCLDVACLDLAIDSKACAVPPCTSNTTGAVLNCALDRFVCAGESGTAKAGAGSSGGTSSSEWCVGLGAFHRPKCCQAGSTCTDGAPSCSEGRSCFTYGAASTNMVHGECRTPCLDDGTCPPRAGVPHVCLGPNHEGGCFLASPGMPCRLGSACTDLLTCHLASPDPRILVTYSPSICTLACSKDADCADDPLGNEGYCECDDGTNDAVNGGCRDGGSAICRLTRQKVAPCTRGLQCESTNGDAMLGTCDARVHP